MKNKLYKIFKSGIILSLIMSNLIACATKPEVRTQQVAFQENTEKLDIKQPQNDKQAEPVKPQPSGNFKMLNAGDDGYFNVENFRTIAEAEKTPGGITLNFENADINEVIAMIVGKILNENYLIDPAVKGTVNLSTVKDLNENGAFYVLENILDIHGARIVRHKDHYRILPKNKALMGMVGFVEDDPKTPLGYGYRVVPLEYIAVSEMVTILESVTNKNTIIRADDKRNLLILGGTSSEVNNMLDTVKLFDVDWMRGTSVALIKVRHSNVNDIIKDLNTMLRIEKTADKASSFVTLESIERLNSIMVITKRRKHINRIREWVVKLDIPDMVEETKLFVYQVKNTNANELASTLMELFTGDSKIELDTEIAALPPGSKPFKLYTDAKAQEREIAQNKIKSEEAAKESGENVPREIKVTPAVDSNSLLIMATPRQYIKIEEALDLLDIPPLQVLIEVTIMDVILTEDLAYGMQWFFKDDGSYTQELTLGDALNFPSTLSYSAVKATGDVVVLLNMLAADGKVDVLSSPSVLVRNNEKASIKVGDQQPISTALVGPDGVIVASSVEYKDTGVLLEIKPTVNTSGTVNVDIVQEVTDTGDIDDATGQRAFLRRSIKSNVSVVDGETIVLGGLIRTNNAETESGVPGLRDIPILGFFFSKTIMSQIRSELIIMMTPKVIRNSDEKTRVVNEYKSKFKNLYTDIAAEN